MKNCKKYFVRKKNSSSATKLYRSRTHEDEAHHKRQCDRVFLPFTVHVAIKWIRCRVNADCYVQPVTEIIGDVLYKKQGKPKRRRQLKRGGTAKRSEETRLRQQEEEAHVQMTIQVLQMRTLSQRPQ